MNKLYFGVLPENKFVLKMMRDLTNGDNKFPAEVMPLVKEIRKITDVLAEATRFTSMALELTVKESTKALMLYLETFGPEICKANFKINRLGKILKEKHGF